MCGRFRLNRFQEMEDEYERLFGFTHLDFVHPPLLGEDILPFRDISVIHKSYDKVQCRNMFWNLIPSNSPRFESNFTWFNTRKEKLEQPYQKSCLQYRRCLVPVNSFLENKKVSDKPVYHSVKIGGKRVRKKESHEFKLKGQEIIALGGIYDIWHDNDSEYLYSCSIITMQPNEIIGEIHNRMPLILDRQQCTHWLDNSNNDADFFLEMVQQYPSDGFEREQVWPPEIKKTRGDLFAY